MTRRQTKDKSIQFIDESNRAGRRNKTARKYDKSWEVQEEREIRHAYWSSIEEATDELKDLTQDLREWTIDLASYVEYGDEVSALQATGWRDATPQEIPWIERAIQKQKDTVSEREAQKRAEEEAIVERLRNERPELFK